MQTSKTGKIGKYRQLNQRQRSALYFKRNHEQDKMDRAHRDYLARTDKDDNPESFGRNLVEKLKIKKGGKLRAKQLQHEAWIEEMSSIGPNEGCSEWM